MDNLDKLVLNTPYISAQLRQEPEMSIMVANEAFAEACGMMACCVIAKAMLKGEDNEMV